jgi:hypothetical protein
MKRTTFFTASALASVLLLFSIGLTAQAAQDGGAISSPEVSPEPGRLQWQECALKVDPSRDRVQYIPVADGAHPAGRTDRQAAAGQNWEVLLNETFEVQFPQYNGWQTFNSIGFAPYYWGKSSYTSNTGSYSGWCCGAHRSGNPDLNPASDDYPNDMKAWMIWGPFDLSNATDAELLFYYWLNTEEGYDILGIMASDDGTQFYGVTTSGNSSGWVGQEEFDLTDVYTLGDLTGDPNVWIAFIFTSDINTASTGVFLDDIMVRREVSANAPPVIVHSPVSSAPAGQDLSITATITDDTGVTGATLYYRRMGQTGFTAATMQPSGDQYTGTIPGTELIPPGAEYYLSATDGSLWSYHPPTDYLTSPHQVAVTDAPPVITHWPVYTGTENADLTITATVTDDGGSPTATLHYRRGGESSFSTVTMTAAGDQFSGTIPGGQVTSRGLEYYLSATDGTNTVFQPAVDPTLAPYVVRVQVGNLVRSGTLTGGSEQTAYRMFSVPLDLDNATVEAVLADDLGEYDETKWRFFRYLQAAYYEHPEAGQFSPGRAFWLIVGQSIEDIDAGSGTTVSTADSFEVTLPPGWTDVGLPFDFPVPARSLGMDTTVVNGPYAYQGQWLLPAQVPYLSSWHGYAFHNVSGSNVTLKIPPVMGMAAAGDGRCPVAEDTNRPGRWALRLRARCEDARDEFNYFGCDPSASPRRDPLDLSEPPPVGSYISLCAVHPDWPEGTGRLAADFRPADRGDEVWDLNVVSNRPGSVVQLTWELDGTIPEELEIRLHDLKTGADLDLRTAGRYQFVYRQERDFRLVAGPAKAVHSNAPGLPQICRLHQNHPNPFNPSTTIVFDLAAASDVELAVYNVLGEKVRTVCSDRLPAGSHRVEFESGDLAAGIYFCRLKAGSFSETRKMVLLR